MCLNGKQHHQHEMTAKGKQNASMLLKNATHYDSTTSLPLSFVFPSQTHTRVYSMNERACVCVCVEILDDVCISL